MKFRSVDLRYDAQLAHNICDFEADPHYTVNFTVTLCKYDAMIYAALQISHTLNANSKH